MPKRPTHKLPLNLKLQQESLGKDSTDLMQLFHIINSLKVTNEVKDTLDKDGFEKKLATRRNILLLPISRREAQYSPAKVVEAHTKKERKELERLKQRSAERQALIEQAIQHGTAPEWAYIKHNERDALNPFMVGFYQDPDGNIKTVYGPRYFQSKRQVKEKGVTFGGHVEDKQVSLLSTDFMKVNKPQMKQTSLFNLLPKDLQERFQRGEILITSNSDLYDFSGEELDDLTGFNNLHNVESVIDNKIAKVESKHTYFLLYYADYGAAKGGRTGVVTYIEDGELRPLIITVDGKEYVLEIKGCGTKKGGFAQKHYRTGRDIITGGVEREQAVNEFDRLLESSTEDGPKAVASILFNNDGYEQGYILRLTPSTVRASYTGNEAYVSIEQPEQIKLILTMYAEQLVEHMFAANPKIIDRSSHSENILVWGNGQRTFTDFSDHVSFADPQYPHKESVGGYMTPKQMLSHYIEMVEEIPGYNGSRDQQVFYVALHKTFLAKGYEIDIQFKDSYQEVAKKIWEQALAYQVFKARRLYHYRAEGVLKELESGIKSEKKFSSATAMNFLKSYEASFQKLEVTIQQLLSKVDNDDRSVLEDLLINIRVRDLKKVLKGLDVAFQLINTYSDRYWYISEKQSLYNASLYFIDLELIFIDPLNQYFEHERDVLEAALMKEDSELLQHAKRELEAKIKQFNDILGDPRTIYRYLIDKRKLEDLITLRYYRDESNFN